MRPGLKLVNASRIALGVLALAIAWAGFQVGTHRHTGILRALAEIRQFFGPASNASNVQQLTDRAPPGPKHSVHLSWKASTSAVVGYNVYRRDASGTIKLNAKPIPDTSYVDNSVQAGQTYHYITKAVGSNGAESGPSNEVQSVVPTP